METERIQELRVIYRVVITTGCANAFYILYLTYLSTRIIVLLPVCRPAKINIEGARIQFPQNVTSVL